jgi:predicted methyltransferase
VQIDKALGMTLQPYDATGRAMNFGQCAVVIIHGDCLDILPTIPDDSTDALPVDPPYHLTTRL